MKTIAYFIVFSICVIGFISCGGNKANDTSNMSNAELQKRVAELQQRIDDDSLLLASTDKDFEEIGNSVEAAMQFTNEASSGAMTKKQFSKKINVIKQTLESNKELIANLKQEVGNSQGSTKNAQRLIKNLEDKENQITELLKEIERLNREMAVIKEENAGLKVTVSNQNQTISNINVQIEEKQRILNALTSQIDDANRQLQVSRNQTVQAEKRITDEYLKEGLELMQIADKIDGFLKPKLKADAVIKAYDHFCDAHKRGHYDALTYISQMKSKKEFAKHLGGKSCN